MRTGGAAAQTPEPLPLLSGRGFWLAPAARMGGGCGVPGVGEAMWCGGAVVHRNSVSRTGFQNFVKSCTMGTVFTYRRSLCKSLDNVSTAAPPGPRDGGAYAFATAGESSSRGEPMCSQVTHRPAGVSGTRSVAAKRPSTRSRTACAGIRTTACICGGAVCGIAAQTRTERGGSVMAAGESTSATPGKTSRCSSTIWGSHLSKAPRSTVETTMAHTAQKTAVGQPLKSRLLTARSARKSNPPRKSANFLQDLWTGCCSAYFQPTKKSKNRRFQAKTSSKTPHPHKKSAAIPCLIFDKHR